MSAWRATSSSGRNPQCSRSSRGRVASQTTRKPPQAGVFPDEGSHVPHAHDAQRPLCGLPPLCTGEVGQYGTRPLQYAAGVAACCRGDPYAVRRAPRCVDVVEPDGGRGDQTDARTCEQAFVAAGAGADDQGVGVAHVLRGDPAAGQVAYLGPRLKDSLKKGDALSATIFMDGCFFLISFLSGKQI